MSKKRKKNIKMRGSKTHGYGAKKRHRGSGSKGGVGMAGGFKNKKTWIFRYDRGHLGKQKGFKSIRQKKIKPSYKSINLRDLQKLAEKNNISGSIELANFNYGKVLSAGELKKPLEVKAKYFSAEAEEKIKKSGGKATKV